MHAFALYTDTWFLYTAAHLVYETRKVCQAIYELSSLPLLVTRGQVSFHHCRMVLYLSYLEIASLIGLCALVESRNLSEIVMFSFT